MYNNGKVVFTESSLTLAMVAITLSRVSLRHPIQIIQPFNSHVKKTIQLLLNLVDYHGAFGGPLNAKHKSKCS